MGSSSRIIASSSSQTVSKPAKTLTISFFVLRVAKNTTFPLMASAGATAPPVPINADGSSDFDPTSRASTSSSPVPGQSSSSQPLATSSSITAPSSLASFNRRNMQAALQAGRSLLTSIAQSSIVQSERDLLWAKMTADAPSSSPDFLSSDQLSQMLRLASSRTIDTLDRTLTSMTSGITTDWKNIMSQLSTTFASFYKTRVFLSEKQLPHLLIFNSADSDLLLHLFITEPRGIEILCVRREFNQALDAKHSSLESAQVALLVNSICHLLWKQLLPKAHRR
jgi:hypothetical protein